MLHTTTRAFFTIRENSTSRKLLLGEKKKKKGRKIPSYQRKNAKSCKIHQRFLLSEATGPKLWSRDRRSCFPQTPLRGSTGITTPATSSCQASAENWSQRLRVIIMHYKDQTQQKSLQSALNRMQRLWKAYLYVFQCQDIFHIPLGYLHLGGYATDSTDHVIVIPDSEALKGPVAIAQQFLELSLLIRAQAFFWKENMPLLQLSLPKDSREVAEPLLCRIKTNLSSRELLQRTGHRGTVGFRKWFNRNTPHQERRVFPFYNLTIISRSQSLVCYG